MKFMWILLSIIIIAVIGIAAFMNLPRFGRLPRGERLERIQNSPNYSNNSFHNLSQTPSLTSDKSFFGLLFEFLFHKGTNLRPKNEIPVVKTDLMSLDQGEDVMVWLGHSSYYIQLEGKKILVDPVFYAASPVRFFNRPFNGTNIYEPSDIPDLDYLIVTHDHWDHLDYKTVKELKTRIGRVVCPIGVGGHFERWGYDNDKLVEMDWNESKLLDKNFTVYCLPARHFSGRGFKRNRTLWASFMLETPNQRVYIGGDGGYDYHFKDIANNFGTIDLAIMENGQYNENWRYIHLMPEDLITAIEDLGPDKIITVHNSKYALSNHPWNEPMRNIAAYAEKNRLNLLTPRIGEVVRIHDSTQKFSNWWEELE